MNWLSCSNNAVWWRTACSPSLHRCPSLSSQAKRRIRVPSWVTVLNEAGCNCAKISFHRHQLRVKRTGSICDSRDTLDCFVLAGLFSGISVCLFISVPVIYGSSQQNMTCSSPGNVVYLCRVANNNCLLACPPGPVFAQSPRAMAELHQVFLSWEGVTNARQHLYQDLSERLPQLMTKEPSPRPLPAGPSSLTPLPGTKTCSRGSPASCLETPWRRAVDVLWIQTSTRRRKMSGF